jgi:hypothetical protein
MSYFKTEQTLMPLRDAYVIIAIDSEERSNNLAYTSSSDFSTNVQLTSINALALQSYRIQGVPTIVTGINDKLIIRYGGSDYTVTLNAGRYGADAASNTASDNIVTELQRAIDATAIGAGHLTVGYLKAANKITILTDSVPTLIRVHGDTPRIGATLGLGASSALADAWNIYATATKLPYCPTLLVSKYIDVHSPELSRFNPPDTVTAGNGLGLLGRIFISQPCFDCEEPQHDQIMHPKFIHFDPKTVGSFQIHITLDGEDGLTFPFESRDTTSIGQQLDISLVLLGKVNQ